MHKIAFATTYLEVIPSLTTVYKLFNCDHLYIADNAGYNKRLRLNQVLISDNITFSVPVSNNQSLLNDYKFEENIYWKQKLLRTIHDSFKSSAFYYYFYDRLQTIVYNSKSFKSLFLPILKFINDSFKLNTQIVLASELYGTFDLRKILDKEAGSLYLVEEKYISYLHGDYNKLLSFNDNKLLINSIFSMIFNNLSHLDKEIAEFC